MGTPCRCTHAGSDLSCRSGDIAVVDELKARLGFEPAPETRVDQGVDFFGAVVRER